MQKVAPYLTIDGRVYPAVVEGKVVWMVDGYTTSAGYPYSASAQLADATVDSLTQRSTTVTELAPQTANYIRNSVKATVDAYSGEVTLYAWDEQDPVLRAWQKVFPGTLKPISEISGDLMSHIRYPEDLFKVQRTLLSNYHVNDAGDFYTSQDFWSTPNDPTQSAAVAQPPYYLTLQMPGQDTPAFSLTSTYIPQGGTREVLTGFLAADAEAGDVAGKPAEGYGKLRLLELPRNSTVPGPGQVQNNFDANPDVSTTLNLLAQGNSTVIHGNLLTLPVGGGLLYVQPVYVQSSSGTQIPLMQKVLVAFGDSIGFADTLGQALDQVFGGDSGANVGNPTPNTGPVAPSTGTPDAPATPAPTAAPTEPAPSTTPGAVAGTPRERLDTALADANAAIQEGQAALAANDFTAYGESQKKLQAALEAAVAAEAELG